MNLDYELFNLVDYAILVVIALSAIISLMRGFVREAFSLAAWIIAFWVAIQYSSELSTHLVEYVSIPSARIGLAFGALFVATLLIGALVNFIVTQLVSKTGLSGTDRFIGIFFGLARGVLVVAVAVMFAGLTVLPQESLWEGSQLLPRFEDLAIWLQGYLPEDYARYFGYEGTI